MNRENVVLLALIVAFAACGGSTGHRKSTPGAAGSHNAGSAADESSAGDGSGAGGAQSANGGASEAEAGSAGEATLQGELEITELRISSCTTYGSGADNMELPRLLTGRDPEQYRGLECVAWDVTDPESSAIDFVNLGTPDEYDSEPSTDLWHEAAQQDDNGVLRITREWDSEYWHMGVGCDRNLSFVIAGVAVEETLRLEFLTRGCTDCSWSERVVIDIPAAAGPAGIVCRHLRDRDLGITMDPPEYPEYAGSLHRPSRGGVCNEGLVPLELEPDWEICAAPCSEQAPECPLPELLSCQNDICELTETW